MSINMPKTIKEERLRWILPIYNKEIRLIDVTKVCPHSKRSLERWLSEYRKNGEKGLEPKSTRPKSHPNETSIREKERIIELRNKTRLCAKKLNYKLKKEGMVIHDRTIGKIIKQEGLVRKYRVRKIQYRYIKVKPSIGELVEIDVKYVPKRLNNKRYYQFTAIDCNTRWRYLKVYENMGSSEAMDFLKSVIDVATFRIRAIKTDNGTCFTNRYTGYLKSSDPMNPKLHSLDLLCQKLNIIHYLIDPGKPAQNGKVERSHRTDQEMFYNRCEFKTIRGLRRKIKQWNIYYNNLEHIALGGKTPNEMLELVN
jgi:transposase